MTEVNDADRDPCEGVSLNKQINEIWEVAEEVCTEWEYGFIKDLMESGMAEDTDELSDRQVYVINRMYRKACRSEF